MKRRLFSEDTPAPTWVRVLLILFGLFLEGFCLLVYLASDWNTVSTILALLGLLFLYAGIQKGKNFALDIFGLMIELIVGAFLGTLRFIAGIFKAIS